MSKGINKAILIGHLGNDPDMKYSSGGKAICNISLATTETWKDRDGNRQERTEWHRCVAFDKLAEIMGEYLTKGSLVYLEGKIRTEKYEDRDGVERYSTKVYVDQMNMLGGRPDGGERPQRQESRQEREPAQGSSRRTAAPTTRRAPPRQSAPPADCFPDDDIPF